MIMPQADSPVTGFRPFFNPATGEWITFTATDSAGQGADFTSDQLAMRHAYPDARPVFLGTDCPARGTA